MPPTDQAAGPVPATGSSPEFELDARWEVHPSVSIRPEPFGALLYHFGNRRLSFLKTRQLLEIVQGLNGAPSARVACADAGVEPGQMPQLARALAALAAGETIRRRD